jgi:hypothetical protein
MTGAMSCVARYPNLGSPRGRPAAATRADNGVGAVVGWTFIDFEHEAVAPREDEDDLALGPKGLGGDPLPRSILAPTDVRREAAPRRKGVMGPRRFGEEYGASSGSSTGLPGAPELRRDEVLITRRVASVTAR